MTKKEMLEVIARAYFPEIYEEDCVAKRRFIEKRMKWKKDNIETAYGYAVNVLLERGIKIEDI